MASKSRVLESIPDTALPRALAKLAAREAVDADLSLFGAATARDLAVAGEFDAARVVVARDPMSQSRDISRQTIALYETTLAVQNGLELPETDVGENATQLEQIALNLTGAHPFDISQNRELRDALVANFNSKPCKRKTAALDNALRRWEAAIHFCQST